MDFLDGLRERILVLDGAMGTMLQQRGLGSCCAEELNISQPKLIRDIHLQYVEAGAGIIETNSFCANRLKLQEYGFGDKVKEFNGKAVENARAAAGGKAFVAGALGPLGKYAEPLGELSFELAYELFAEQASALGKADLLLVETISDIKIAKAAILAAKDNFQKPVVCSMTYDAGRTVTGTDPKTAATVLEALGADAIGLNCGGGPEEQYSVVESLAKTTNLPIIVYPNAGLPQIIDGRTVFKSDVRSFIHYAEKFIGLGANILGGCCGTTPEYINAIAGLVEGRRPVKRKNQQVTRLASRTRTIDIDRQLIIGESINPNNKEDLTAELKEKRTMLVRELAVRQKRNGANLIDVNVSAPGVDEGEMLCLAMGAVEAATDAPIVLDSTSLPALEEALKNSCGKPLINSVNANPKSLKQILPLAKRYGAAVIGLTLDENGIPRTAEGRVAAAEKIIIEAGKLGIEKKDLLIDCIVSTIAAERGKAAVTLEALKQVKKMGVKTVLGISNVSVGLPDRRKINFSFLCQALRNGLDIPILDPFDNAMVSAVKNSENLDFNQDLETVLDLAVKVEKRDVDRGKGIGEQLADGVEFGVEDEIIPLVEEALEKYRPLEVNGFLLNGMAIVGKKFREKQVFLPSVMLSASTMKQAFSILKKKIVSERNGQGATIIFATVKNDVHDLGKNIVISLLEANGYDVIDLGKNIGEKEIVDAVKEKNAALLCLSALMTTTMTEMPRVISELRKEGISVPVMVGGAIVNQEFADGIGAGYGKDAIEAVSAVKLLSRKAEWWKK